MTVNFTLWIDADACPKAVRSIIFKAASRLSFVVKVVANCSIPVPPLPLVERIIVDKGPDVADNYIVDALNPGDIVITADIPLAKNVVKKGGLAIDIRGTLYSDNNIGERCAVRDLLHDLREDGMRLGGPAPFGQKDRQQFANTFDRTITKRLSEDS